MVMIKRCEKIISVMIALIIICSFFPANEAFATEVFADSSGNELIDGGISGSPLENEFDEMVECIYQMREHMIVPRKPLKGTS